MARPRLIVALSGASGVVLGIRALQMLRSLSVETHLVMTRAAELTVTYETPMKLAEVHALADHVWRHDDIGAPIASGTFRTQGMLVAPCSIRSLSEIATGVTAGLLSRAADVVLKERRRLVLAVRETPYHLGHLRTMAAVTEMGAIVAPPVPAFYARPRTVEDLVDQMTGRLIELCGIEVPQLERWGETIPRTRPPAD